MKILITSGGTRVPIDSVRYIGNMSSGRLGMDLAWAFDVFYDGTHDVHFFHAKGSHHPVERGFAKKHPTEYIFNSFDEYLGAPKVAGAIIPDIIISAAAVSDYILEKTEGKISSESDELIIKLKKAPKILPQFKKVSPSSMVVGFKLLVSPSYDEVHKAVKKVLNSGADLVVYNDLTEIRKGVESRIIFDKDMNFVKVDNAAILARALLEIREAWEPSAGNNGYTVFSHKQHK